MDCVLHLVRTGGKQNEMKVLAETMTNWSGYFMPAIDLSLFDSGDVFPDFNEKSLPAEEDSSRKEQDGSDKKRKRRRKKALTGLSKKRREANARERRRIEELNHAFVDLKKALPLPNVDVPKLGILSLAIRWIDHLGTLLKDYDEQRDLLKIKQMETSRPGELVNIGEDTVPFKHDCLYHHFPDLKNTLWEESIGLEETPSLENEGCVHIRSISNFRSLFL